MEIRFLTVADVAAYRELRLQALQESPTAFGSSYEQEICLSLAEFAARIGFDTANRFICAAVDDRQQMIGMLGFSRESRLKRAHIGAIWSMYVVPKFRNQGVGAALLDQVLAHARELGVLRQIILGVTANNSAAISLYRSRGFKRFGLEHDALFVDGTYFDEEHLVLYFTHVYVSSSKYKTVNSPQRSN